MHTVGLVVAGLFGLLVVGAVVLPNKGPTKKDPIERVWKNTADRSGGE
jgi:hypothetical protein